MKKRLKKYLAALIIVIMTIALVGCVNVELGTDVSMNLDGSTKTVIRVGYDDNIAKVIGDVNILDNLHLENFNITKFKDGELNVEEAQYQTEKLNLKQIIRIVLGSNFAKNENWTNDYVSANLNRKKGLFQDTYDISVVLKKDIYKEVSTAIDNEINTYGSNVLTQHIGGNVKDLVEDIPYKLSLNIPFKIVASNATTVINDNTVSWEYNIKNLSDGEVLTFSFKAINVINLMIFALIIIVVAVIYIVVRKKKNKHKFR